VIILRKKEFVAILELVVDFPKIDLNIFLLLKVEMHLHINVVGDSGSNGGNKNILKEFYLEGLQKHTANLKTIHADSGFDLFCPRDLTIPPNETSFIDLGIQCAAYKKVHTDGGSIASRNKRRIKFSRSVGIGPMAFYVYPRSSLSKTPLRLANSVGIIDMGYRGNIIAAVDNIGGKPFQLRRATRLFQICAPDLSPINVELVDFLDKTARGAGGFGSTGQ